MDFAGKVNADMVKEFDALRRRLDESRGQYRILGMALAGMINEGIVFCAMDGRATDANAAYLEMLGYSIEELRAASYQQLTPERWRLIEQGICEKQVMKRGYSDSYEKELKRKDGKIIQVRMRTWLIRDENELPWRLLSITRMVEKQPPQ